MTEHLLFSVILQWPAEATRNLTSPLAPNVLYPSLSLSWNLSCMWGSMWTFVLNLAIF